MSWSETEISIAPETTLQTSHLISVSSSGDFSSEGVKQFIEYSDERGTVRLDFLWVSFDITINKKELSLTWPSAMQAIGAKESVYIRK